MKSNILLLLFIFMNIFSSAPRTQNNDRYVFTKEQEIKTNGTGHYVSKSIYIDSLETLMNIVTSKGIIEINDKYQKHIYKEDTLYICSKNKIYIIDLNLLSFNTYETDLEIEDFTINEYIYLIGSKNKNPKIIVLSKEGDLLKEKEYSGDGYGKFKYIKDTNNELIVILEKDAFFTNDEFLKVGSKNDIKSVVIKLSKTLEIIEIYYFNEYKEKEEVTSLLCDQTIKLMLYTQNEYFLYEFDFDLNLLKRQIIETKYDSYLVDNISGDDLILTKYTNGFDINLFNNDLNINVYHSDKCLVNFDVVDEGIVFSYSDFISLYSEYHIEKSETLILDKLYYDINSTNHFKVSSFFEILDFSQDYITPYHQHMMSGSYDATYVAKNKYGSNIYISTPVIIKDYVNIINKGIYKTGTKLFFFGKAYLNGEVINNGHSLSEEGEYELVLEDINKNKKVYSFKVVDDYYKDNDHFVMDVDYKVKKSDFIELNIETDNPSLVNTVIIDDLEYNDFIVTDNTIKVMIKPSDSFGYFTKTINSIKVDDYFIPINKTFSYLVLKDIPTLDIKTTLVNDEYLIDIYYIDYNNSFVDIYFDKQTKVFYYTYELGDGILYKQEIAHVDDENVLYQVIKDDSKITIKINAKTINNLYINNEDVYIKDNNQINKIIFLFSISSTVIIAILLLITLIIKRIKTRNINRI